MEYPKLIVDHNFVGIDIEHDHGDSERLEQLHDSDSSENFCVDEHHHGESNNGTHQYFIDHASSNHVLHASPFKTRDIHLQLFINDVCIKHNNLEHNSNQHNKPSRANM